MSTHMIKYQANFARKNTSHLKYRISLYSCLNPVKVSLLKRVDDLFCIMVRDISIQDPRRPTGIVQFIQTCSFCGEEGEVPTGQHYTEKYNRGTRHMDKLKFEGVLAKN